MKYICTLVILFTSIFFVTGQMKVMDQTVYSEWKQIKSEAISNDGIWVKYHVSPGKGDQTLEVYNTLTNEKLSYQRVKRSEFTEDNRYLLYSKSAAVDSVILKRRRKVEKKDLPKDTLVIINLSSFEEVAIPHIGTYKLPKRWSGIVAYQADVTKVQGDSLSSKSGREQRFFIHHLDEDYRDTLSNVDSYEIAEEGAYISYTRSGQDTSLLAGVFMYSVVDRSQIALLQGLGSYYNTVISKKGDKVSFIADLDTSKRRVRPHELYLWKDGLCQKIVSHTDRLRTEPMFVNANTKPSFSENGENLYFGIGRHPVLADSLSLDEEQVQVEVWTSEDALLYTMQELQEDRLKKETYLVKYDINSNKLIPLESELKKNIELSEEGNGKYFLVSNTVPYDKSVTWTGQRRADYFLGSLSTGRETKWKEGLNASPSFSPAGKFVYWFDREDLNWYSKHLESGKEVNLTSGNAGFVDELNDRPMKPGSYGLAGWDKDDRVMYIYDRYDIWKFDPLGLDPGIRLTNGREVETQWRIIDLDSEEDALTKDGFAYLFNEKTKESGYAKIDLSTGERRTLVLDSFSFDRRPRKAKHSDLLLYTKESFEVFPDLLLSSLEMKEEKVISSVNPQQDDYRWGSIELFQWKDYDGRDVEGLLVKPEGFDPMKKYPVIVNFYERSSNGLHRHRAPEPHRSTVNYAYYANKGFIIFNPDVNYEIGEPGASAYNAVVSGVEALSKNQFIDKSRIGVQGHSWGGYQIAHLLNKTSIFKCAESGAPVVNMVSAYGGIRWGSGMSRMFQYEKTQSRLGATLWENPDLYLRNSPIFEMDKMNTPVLILHNDNDSAVPWYQGIEYFMALRRLGKPAWFLNYNGEPHWPLKWENRLDFNRRMEQFFAHYLLDEPMPRWMKEGVSVVDKGINQGFEVDE